jgi:hypothetical protein
LASGNKPGSCTKADSLRSTMKFDLTKLTSFLLPSIASVLFLIIFFPLSFLGQPLLQDTDTGIHIRTGEVILETMTIPKYDVFSFHHPPLPWTAHEWLSQVIMALVHRRFGLAGVVVFFSGIIALIYFLLFKFLRASGNNIILTVFLVLLVVASSTLHWLARPHLFSLLFIIVYQRILDLYQYRNKNYLYVLPLLMLVWVNLHGGFIVGLMLIGIYLAGNLTNLLFSSHSDRSIGGKTSVLGFAFLGCLLMSLVNPYGYHILLFPLRLVSDKFIMDYIGEFMSPNFHDTLPYRYLLFLTIGIFALSGSRANIIELTLIVLFTHMSLYSARYIPLFAVIVSPILLRHADAWLESADGKIARYLKTRAEHISPLDSSAKGHLWTIGAGILVFIALANGRIHFEFDDKVNPVAAVRFLKRENLKGNMFNNDTFGDYLIYAAWPQYRVFVDGRSDMYGASRMKDYDKAMRPTPEWETVLEKYAISWVFDYTHSRLSTLLLSSQDWQLIYADKVAHIFMKNTPQNQQVIQKYPNVKPIQIDKKVDS